MLRLVLEELWRRLLRCARLRNCCVGGRRDGKPKCECVAGLLHLAAGDKLRAPAICGGVLQRSLPQYVKESRLQQLLALELLDAGRWGSAS